MRQDLVERARQGDREAFGQLAAGEVDRLHAIARLILRDADLAEDAVQETLVRSWRQLPKLRDPAAFDAWIHRVLVHAAADELRRRRRHEGSIGLIDHEPAVGDVADSLADREQLERGFQRLSFEQRSVVVLHHYVGLSLAEAANALGIPHGTAKTRYFRALEYLRAALDADERATRGREVPA